MLPTHYPLLYKSRSFEEDNGPLGSFRGFGSPLIPCFGSRSPTSFYTVPYGTVIVKLIYMISESPPTASPWRGWTWTTAWLSLTRSSTHSLPKTRSAILSSEWHQSKDQLYMISLLPRHALEMVQNEPGMKSLVLKIMDPRQSAEQKRYVGGADITQKWSCLHQVSMSQGLKGAAEIYGWFWSSCCGLWEPYW